ncbi:hypothetical protein P9432_27180, partial [Escherichia coli]|uniref:hypothetical protein n=1 Tax=Escherichia coli TaxID=562 RepID=UPI00389165FA
VLSRHGAIVELADLIQTGLDVNLLAGGRVTRISHELLKVGDSSLGAPYGFGLLGVDTLGVPIGGKY